MKTMRILFFTKGDITVGSSRARVWLLAKHLEKTYGYQYTILHGIKYISWMPSVQHVTWLRRVVLELRKPYDIIYVHKSLFPLDIIFFLVVARCIGRKRLIYDLDDAEWRHSFINSFLLAYFADIIFCGSHAIQKWAARYNSRTMLVPTVVDDEVYARNSVTHQKRDIVTIGWVGVGKAHFLGGHFDILRSVFEHLARAGIKFRFIVIGSQRYQPLKNFFEKSTFPVIFVDDLDWEDAASVPHAIQEYQFDIGVMPLHDNDFNRAKCAFKAIEYMACSVPPVASRVGESVYLIRDRENGFLVESKEEWVNILKELVNNDALRKKIGVEAQKTIKQYYSMNAILPIIARQLEALLLV